MPRFHRAIFAAASVLLLTGCAAPGLAGEEPSSTASASASAAPSPTETVAEERTVTVTLDGLTVTGDATEESAALEDPDAVLALVEELTGQARVGVDIPNPWGEGDPVGTLYEWDGVTVSVIGERASLVVRAATVGGASFQTEQGVAVGATRAEAVAAGAWDDWDEDGDGVADYLGIGEREVPGTESLSRPGETGIEYVMLGVKGDVVEQIHVPANDFSDL